MMTRRIRCTCGAVVNVAAEVASVRCPECARMVTDKETLSGPASPDLAPEKVRKRKRSAAPPPDADSRFTPEESGTPQRKVRRTSRKNLESHASGAEADINPFPPWLREWIDPGYLFWMPILAPALAFTSGVVIFGFSLRRLGILGMPGMLFGSLLALMPVAWTILHWSEILQEWCKGADRDPEWPTYDAFEMLRKLIAWSGSALLAGAIGYGCSWAILLVSAKSGWQMDGFALLVGWAVGFAYFPIALLASILWDNVIAANPLSVIAAMSRLRSRVFPFAIEYAGHLLALTAAVHGVLLAKQRSLALAMAFWLVWWCFCLLSGARLMRILGRLYVANARRIGWFSQ